jgi:hypothetical protein
MVLVFRMSGTAWTVWSAVRLARDIGRHALQGTP